jgi:hypothetical protein
MKRAPGVYVFYRRRSADHYRRRCEFPLSSVKRTCSSQAKCLLLNPYGQLDYSAGARPKAWVRDVISPNDIDVAAQIVYVI